jgi:hypothetical protein
VSGFIEFCMFTMAGIMIVSTITGVVRSVQVRRSGVSATAEVIGINTYTGQASIRRARVVRFATPYDGEVTTQLPSGQLRDTPVGARVGIRYLPQRPKVARSDGSVRYFWGLIFNVLWAGVFIAIGVSALSSSR